MNDYVRIPYANGSSFASQFLYREFARRGHDVTVVGPRDPKAQPADLPGQAVCLPSLPLRNHPGVHMPFPSRRSLNEVADANFDIMLGQTGSELMDLGVWLRRTHKVPLLCVNTIHLPSVYNVLLPERLHDNGPVNAVFSKGLIPFLERRSAHVYNQSDGLIVLSAGLRDYWRARGVRVPIHVIPRAVDPGVFDAPARKDPFPASARPGSRLLVVCRHTREKSVSRLLGIFAREILPQVPHATLTLAGDGPDHDTFKQHAEQLGVAHCTFFPGEISLPEIPDWYRHADLFLYTSLSETYGQVVSEAMWCGLPVVAFADGMGVSQQIVHGQNGYAIPPGPDTHKANVDFGTTAVRLLNQHAERRAMASEARRLARLRSDPERAVARYYEAFEQARLHCEKQTSAEGTSGLGSSVAPVVQWAWIHAAVVGLGLLRPPATVNRHGRRQPGWERSEQQTKPDGQPVDKWRSTSASVRRSRRAFASSSRATS